MLACSRISSAFVFMLASPALNHRESQPATCRLQTSGKSPGRCINHGSLVSTDGHHWPPATDQPIAGERNVLMICGKRFRTKLVVQIRFKNHKDFSSKLKHFDLMSFSMSARLVCFQLAAFEHLWSEPFYKLKVFNQNPLQNFKSSALEPYFSTFIVFLSNLKSTLLSAELSPAR